MTFIEAALEILRREGTPLHARLIAEKAVDAEILSHVGKTPVQTMSKRISAAVAKGKGPFVRVKPGVFALSEWADAQGKITPPGKKESKDKNKASAPARETDKNVQPRAVSEPSQDTGAKRFPDSRAPLTKDEKRPREERPREERTREDGDGPTDDAGGRRGKSRTRRTRNRSKESNRPPERRNDNRGEVASGTASASAASNAPDNAPSGQANAAPQGTAKKAANASRPPAPNGGVVGEVGRFLEKQNQPQSARAIAGRFHISGNNAETIVDALLEADNLERRKSGRRPRFVKHRNGWALSAREIPSEVVQLENEVFQNATRLAQIAERQIQRRLKSLSSGKLTQLVILVLRQMGYGEVESIARGREDECHLRVADRRQGGRFSTAVIIRNESQGRAISDVDVTELRGSLHHYKASRGLIVTTGEISVQGIREADVPNLPPVGFIDGKMLALEMVRYSIGVEKRTVQLAFFDDSWF